MIAAASSPKTIHGFTLLEVLVGIGIMTLITSTLGTALFHTIRSQQGVLEDSLAVNEARKAFSWFAEDVKMAQTGDLVDGGPAVSSVILNWTDEYQEASIPHTSSYVLTGDKLVRIYDGESHIVAHRVVSVGFSRASNTITVQLEVEAGGQTTDTESLKTVMRSAAQ